VDVNCVAAVAGPLRRRGGPAMNRLVRAVFTAARTWQDRHRARRNAAHRYHLETAGIVSVGVREHVGVRLFEPVIAFVAVRARSYQPLIVKSPRDSFLCMR
jgi:hypothetical protein